MRTRAAGSAKRSERRARHLLPRCRRIAEDGFEIRVGRKGRAAALTVSMVPMKAPSRTDFEQVRECRGTLSCRRVIRSGATCSDYRSSRNSIPCRHFHAPDRPQRPFCTVGARHRAVRDPVGPLGVLWDYARQVDESRGLQLLPGLIILAVMFVFHQTRKRHESRAHAVASEAESRHATARAVEMERLVNSAARSESRRTISHRVVRRSICPRSRKARCLGDCARRDDVASLAVVADRSVDGM